MKGEADRLRSATGILRKKSVDRRGFEIASYYMYELKYSYMGPGVSLEKYNVPLPDLQARLFSHFCSACRCGDQLSPPPCVAARRSSCWRRRHRWHGRRLRCLLLHRFTTGREILWISRPVDTSPGATILQCRQLVVAGLTLLMPNAGAGGRHRGDWY